MEALKVASGRTLAESKDAADGNAEADCHGGNGERWQIRVCAPVDGKQRVEVFGLQLPRAPPTYLGA